MTSGTRILRVALEILGIIVAAGLAALAMWHLASTDRSWLLFYDGDSMQIPLVRASLAAGGPQDWSMSSVLFIPDLAIYLAVSLLGAGVSGTALLWGGVMLVVLYAAYRTVAWAVVPASSALRHIVGGWIALGAVVLWVLCDSNATRGSAQIVSLIVTTGYYGASVIAMVFAVGLTARSLAQRGDGRTARIALAILCGVGSLSVTSNPLYIAYFVGPAIVVLAGLALARRVRARDAAVIGGVIALSAVLGMLGRIPLDRFIGQSGLNYIRWGEWESSFTGFRDKVLGLVSTVPGALSIALLLIVMVLAVLATVAAWRRSDLAATFVAAFAVLVGPALVVGSIALGLGADRYLVPVYLGPALALATLPSLRERGRRRETRTRIIAAAAVVILMTTAFVVAAEVTATRSVKVARAETSVECMVDYLNPRDLTAVGEFWASRSTKARLADPSSLLQVDGNLVRYTWLVNREDYPGIDSVEYVLSYTTETYVITRANLLATPVDSYTCGRYTLTRYDRPLLLTDLEDAYPAS